MSELELAFDAAIVDLHGRIKSAGYNPIYFGSMLSDLGGLATAKKLINSQGVPSGFLALVERGLVDLSLEAFICDNPKWHSLFTQDEIDRCQARLTDAQRK